MKFLVLLGLFAVAYATDNIIDCEDEGAGSAGDVSEINFGDCAASPCSVTPGDTLSFSATLDSAGISTETLAVKIEAKLGDAPWLDFTSLVNVDSDGCNSISPACPVEEGSSYTFETAVVTDDLFAGATVGIKLKLIADGGENFVCKQLEVAFDA